MGGGWAVTAFWNQVRKISSRVPHGKSFRIRNGDMVYTIPPTGFVYLAQSERIQSLFKVGWSVNASRRVAQVRSEYRVPLVLVDVIEVSTRHRLSGPGPDGLEGAMHRSLREYRVCP